MNWYQSFPLENLKNVIIHNFWFFLVLSFSSLISFWVQLFKMIFTYKARFFGYCIHFPVFFHLYRKTVSWYKSIKEIIILFPNYKCVNRFGSIKVKKCVKTSNSRLFISIFVVFCCLKFYLTIIVLLPILDEKLQTEYFRDWIIYDYSYIGLFKQQKFYCLFNFCLYISPFDFSVNSLYISLYKGIQMGLNFETIKYMIG